MVHFCLNHSYRYNKYLFYKLSVKSRINIISAASEYYCLFMQNIGGGLRKK